MQSAILILRLTLPMQVYFATEGAARLGLETEFLQADQKHFACGCIQYTMHIPPEKVWIAKDFGLKFISFSHLQNLN